MRITQIYTSNEFQNNGNLATELWVLEDGRHVVVKPATGDEYYEDEKEFETAYSDSGIEFELTDRTGELEDPIALRSVFKSIL